MVINTNMTGTGGALLANSTDRSASKLKVNSPSGTSSGVAAPSSLDSQVAQIFAGGGSDIQSGDAASAITQLVKTNMLQQPSTAMLAQANLLPESALSLLQE